jgi:hypothetical protein
MDNYSFCSFFFSSEKIARLSLAVIMVINQSPTFYIIKIANHIRTTSNTSHIVPLRLPRVSKDLLDKREREKMSDIETNKL